MRKVIGIAAAALLLASAGFAATVVGSKHDLRATGGGTPAGTGLTEVCVVCHTPHQVPAANAQDPLWNHTGTVTSAFGVYASGTLNAVPTNIGGAAMGAQSVSMLCMSCHDGTVSVVSMYNNPNGATPTPTAVALRIDALGKIISNSNVGTDLSNDHPVNFLYDAALVTADGPGQLVIPASTTQVVAGVPLFAGFVQCSSCHDVHSPTFTPFLVADNAASALCLKCHIK